MAQAPTRDKVPRPSLRSRIQGQFGLESRGYESACPAPPHQGGPAPPQGAAGGGAERQAVSTAPHTSFSKS